MMPGHDLKDVITSNNMTTTSTTTTATSTPTSSSSSVWSWQENKIFEVELVNNPNGTVNRLERITEKIPGRSAEEVVKHYGELLQDLTAIEAAPVEFPSYQDVDDDAAVYGADCYYDSDGVNVKNEENQGFRNSWNCGNPSSSRPKTENKKQRGNPWSEDEHKAFLRGLSEYGRGDWRSISRYAVKTRTPSQVASHAQKFFLRAAGAKKSKRKSIHDITEC